MYDYQHNTKIQKNTKFVKRHVAVASEANTTMSVQFGSSLSQRPIFIFLLQMLRQITRLLTG